MAPSVSVILPARNEAANIEQALTSLGALRYEDLEIVVVNDRSTDETEALARRFAERYPGPHTLRVLSSPQEPPTGWVGKTFAADYAIARSMGEVIVVCDADVRHAPESLAETVAHFRGRRLELMSRLPHFDIRSWGECPLLVQTALLYWCSRLASALGSRQSFGMGTYLVFTRAFYERSGGWQAHREYPESLPLIRWAYATGARFAFMRDTGGVVARMHVGWRLTYKGLVRNSNFSLLLPLPLGLFVAAVALLSLALYAALAGMLLGWAGLLAAAALLAAHLASAGYRPAVILGACAWVPLMPLYWLAVAGAALGRSLSGTPLSWRGRDVPA